MFWLQCLNSETSAGDRAVWFLLTRWYSLRWSLVFLMLWRITLSNGATFRDRNLISWLFVFTEQTVWEIRWFTQIFLVKENLFWGLLYYFICTFGLSSLKAVWRLADKLSSWFVYIPGNVFYTINSVACNGGPQQCEYMFVGKAAVDVVPGHRVAPVLLCIDI